MDQVRDRKALLISLQKQYQLWQLEDAARVRRNKEILEHLTKTETHLNNLLEELSYLKKYHNLGKQDSYPNAPKGLGMERNVSTNVDFTSIRTIQADFVKEAQKRFEAIIENNLNVSEAVMPSCMSFDSEDGKYDLDLFSSDNIEIDDTSLLVSNVFESKVMKDRDYTATGSMCNPNRLANEFVDEEYQEIRLKPQLDSVPKTEPEPAPLKPYDIDSHSVNANTSIREKEQTLSSSNKTTLNSCIPSISKEAIKPDKSEWVLHQNLEPLVNQAKKDINCPNEIELLEECVSDYDPIASKLETKLVVSKLEDSAKNEATEPKLINHNESISKPDKRRVSFETVEKSPDSFRNNPVLMSKKPGIDVNKVHTVGTLTSGKVLQMFSKLSSLDSDSSSDKNDQDDDFFD